MASLSIQNPRLIRPIIVHLKRESNNCCRQACKEANSVSAALNRRNFCKGTIAASFGPMCSNAAAALDNACVLPHTSLLPPPVPDRAVSLNNLLAAAQTRTRPIRIDGLTRLDGFLIRGHGDDIVLVGASNAGQPELFLDDFIIAVRAFWEGKRPAISIDPDPELFSRLSLIKVLSDPNGQKRYAELCRAPQTVRVDGLPRHSRVAKTLVEADYRMKLIAQGHVRLPINPPLMGPFDRSRQSRDDEGRQVQTRFWFECIRFDCEHDVALDSVMLMRVPVLLRDEDQRLDSNNSSGNVDRFSREFACTFTSRIEEIYRAEPIWRSMENIYRHFALARKLEETGIRFHNSLHQRFAAYECDKITVPDTLPGSSRIEQSVDGRWRVVQKSCGGVSLRIERHMISTVRAKHDELQRMVIGSMPSSDAVSWTVSRTAQLPIKPDPFASEAIKVPKPFETKVPKPFETKVPEPSENPFDASTYDWHWQTLTMVLSGMGVFFASLFMLQRWLYRTPPRTAEATLSEASKSSRERIPLADVERLRETLAKPGTADRTLVERARGVPKQSMSQPQKIGRNEQCPCGSGKRFKHCHGTYQA
jgi:hypothetical protein